MRKLKFRPDLVYLDWAEAWLQGLREANRQAQCYPDPAFSDMLGRFWLKVCWYASADIRWTAWRRFWGSPLHKIAWQGLRRLVFLYTIYPFRRGKIHD